MLLRRISSLFSKVTEFEKFTSINSLSLLAPSDKQLFLQKIEKNAKVDYKVYPALPHQDPNSPEYVHSEVDEDYEQREVKDYNEIISQFKHDMKLQREVWDSISKLDRPYKRGIRGIDTNLNDQVATVTLPKLGFPRQKTAEETNQKFFLNQDRYISTANWHFKITFENVLEWEKERMNRPVIKDPHPKGYKYDVLIKPEEKYEYMADRLGHPQFLGTPLERLLKLEKDLYHPGFVDQPFVKQPRYTSHPSLNFEQGEVIYENSRILEWIRGIQIGSVALIAYFGVVLPLNIGFKTNLVTDMADEFLKKSLHYTSPFQVDYLKLFTPVATVGVYYVLYSVMRMITEMGAQYAVKVSYSKDRELLFVKRINSFGKLQEDVYETAHLEILPPSPRSGVAYLSSQDEDGLWRITCMNTHKTFLLYNESKFWNLNLKQKFIAERLNLWDKSYYGYNRPEGEEMNRQWRKSVLESFDQEALPKPKPKNAAHAQSKANPKSHKEYKAKTHDKTKEKTESEIHTDPKTAPEATANSKVQTNADQNAKK